MSVVLNIYEHILFICIQTKKYFDGWGLRLTRALVAIEQRLFATFSPLKK